MKERLNQFRTGGGAIGGLIAYYQMIAGVIPESDLIIVATLWGGAISVLGDFCHGWFIEGEDGSTESEEENDEAQPDNFTSTTGELSDVKPVSTKESGNG